MDKKLCVCNERKEMEWIKCSERMPEPNQLVIGYDGYSITSARYQDTTCTQGYGKKKKYWQEMNFVPENQHGYCGPSVTFKYWLHIPELPKD